MAQVHIAILAISTSDVSGPGIARYPIYRNRSYVPKIEDSAKFWFMPLGSTENPAEPRQIEVNYATREIKIKEAPKLPDLELKSLNQFWGSADWYKGYMNVLLTEGAKYVSDNGYGWFVSDAAVIARRHPEEEFLVFKLTVIDGATKHEIKGNEILAVKSGKIAEMEVTDGNEKIVHSQIYELTDAKVSFKLYFSGNVLMLPSEY